MPQRLSQLPQDSKIKLGRIYGADIVWKIIGKGHEGYPDGSVTLLTDKIISIRCFDGKEASNSDSNRKSYGNNDYNVSNIRQWMNSTAGAGEWYTAQHSADAPPNATNTNYNPYEAQAGFLNAWTPEERAVLLDTSLKYAGWSSNGKTCTDKVFLLSTNEVGLETLADNGTAFACFNSNNARIAYPSSQALANSNYTNNNLAANKGWHWWLRTSYASNSFCVRRVYTVGTLNNDDADNGYDGLRPACNLSSEIFVSDTTDADGCYSIIYNEPPTAPATLTVPEEIKSTIAYEVAWSQATDPDGNLSGYVLERDIDGAGWTTLYTGSARAYTDTMPYGTESVRYRVKSYDSSGTESAYVTSAAREVTNNRPPIISGQDDDLGQFSRRAPSMEYVVTDADGDEVTVSTYLDTMLLSSGPATLGQTETVTLTDDQWAQVLNGDHVFRVVATDERGDSATRTVAWAKAVHTASFELAEPMPADDMPTVALLNVQGSFPNGCTLSVMICNNANDAAPDWEDATSAARFGTKHFFSNTTKTAEEWGVSIKVELSRGSAEGDVYIQSIGGNYA